MWCSSVIWTIWLSLNWGAIHWNRLSDYQPGAAILEIIFTNINNLYNPPKKFSDHNIVVYEPVTSFTFNAGTTIDIDIRLSNPKANGNLWTNMVG